MKSLTRAIGFSLALGVLAASSASADVSRLSLKFGGGCHKGSTGKCILKVSATGSDLSSDTVVFQSAATERGHFRNVSTRLRSLASGNAEISFHNADGCYRAVTGNNGNDLPDRRSNVICEK